MSQNMMDNWVDSEHNPLKKIIKILVRRSVTPLIKAINMESQRIETNSQKMLQLDIALRGLSEQIKTNGQKALQLDIELRGLSEQIKTNSQNALRLDGELQGASERIEINSQKIMRFDSELQRLANRIETNGQKTLQLDIELQELANRVETNSQKMPQVDCELRKLSERIDIKNGKVDYLEDVLLDQNLHINEISGECQQKISNQAERIDTILARNSKYEKKEEEIFGALAREITRTYWGLKDFAEQMDSQTELEEVMCPICGHVDQPASMETKETDCIFGGGHLIRYVCTKCGGVFGPTKFSNRTQSEMDDDYIINYTGYQEADSTNYEIDTFLMLSPSKDGIYLNYGCGIWAETLKKLNEEGYRVYGYEPYAVDIDNPFIISDVEQLKKMRFDGIFSHDLLEHLKNPIEDLMFMKSLLKSVTSKMAHATACYRYKYEYTRFHTAFYTGDAVKYLCKKSGINIVNYKDDGKNLDFTCYVFGILDPFLSFKEDMYSTQYGHTLIIDEINEKIFGPYLDLAKGKYKVIVEIEAEKDALLVVTSKKGEKLIESFVISAGIKNQFEIFMQEDEEMVEFVISSEKKQKIQLKRIGFF